jgi:hypothetical protein
MTWMTLTQQLHDYSRTKNNDDLQQSSGREYLIEGGHSPNYSMVGAMNV